MFVLDSGGAPIKLDAAKLQHSRSLRMDRLWVLRLMERSSVVAQLGVVKVVNPSGLEKLGGNLYRMTANANPDGDEDT